MAAKVATKVYRVEGEEDTRSWREGGTLVFKFVNGPERIPDLSDLPDGIRDALAMHGLAQKLGDSYVRPDGKTEASREKQAEYDADPAGYGLATFDALYERLTEGEWVTRAEESGPRTTLLAEALARATGKEISECVTMLDTQRKSMVANKEDKAGQKKWKEFRDNLTKVKEVGEALKAIRIERLQAREVKTDDNAPTLEGLGLA